MSKDEPLIMYSGSKKRPANVATFMIANFDRITLIDHEPILVGGLVTMINNAIGLRQPLLGLHPLGKFQPMNIWFYFNTGIIKNLCPREFELLINN